MSIFLGNTKILATNKRSLQLIVLMSRKASEIRGVQQ